MTGKWLFRRFIPNDFWHGERSVSPFEPGSLRGYYNDLTGKTRPYAGPCSPEGVPLVKTSRQSHVLHPVTVCQVALGWYQCWSEHEEDSYHAKFLTLADWLVANQSHAPDRGGVWPVTYGVPVYGLKPGWISALVQGQALSVLARAYDHTGQVAYLDAARQAIAPFTVSVAAGGIRIEPDGFVFFEEYPTPLPSMVLNGFISALWGLYDFALVSGEETARDTFDDGLRSLIHFLPAYDTGFWSRYALGRQPGRTRLASPYYHREHIVQLRATVKLTGMAFLHTTADHWEACTTNPLNTLRVVAAKAWSRAMGRLT